MRNIFDQYSQPENRLTHALACCLNEDRELLRRFTEWITERKIPKHSTLRLYEQHVPGEPQLNSEEEIERRGLPDLWIDDDTTRPLLIECKVQARVSGDQLRRHRHTARRNGFEPDLVVIVPGGRNASLPSDVTLKSWPEVFSWFRHRTDISGWAGKMVEYMQVMEAKMTAEEYLRDGALTRFDGIPFDAEHPYTYLEAKRVLRQLMEELSRRNDLFRAGVDTRTKRRAAITGSQANDVWDYLAPRRFRGASNFTTYPHFVVSIHLMATHANVVVPNGVRGGLRRRMAELGEDGFVNMIADLASRLQRTAMRGAEGAYPRAYIVQRRYLSRRGPVVEDAKLDFDMRTAADRTGRGVRPQPEWAQMLFHAIANKHSNMQFALGATYSHAGGALRSARDALDQIAHAWIATAPIIDDLVPVESR